METMKNMGNYTNIDPVLREINISIRQMTVSELRSGTILVQNLVKKY